MAKSRVSELRELDCPSEFKPKSRVVKRLLRVLGMARFVELQREFGGERISIPKRETMWPCALCVVRDDCMKLWRREGFAARDIAEYLRVSPSTVRRALRGGGGRRQLVRAAAAED
jgi:hypothetical protein